MRYHHLILNLVGALDLASIPKEIVDTALVCIAAELDMEQRVLTP